MASLIEALGIDLLSVEERRQLAEELWDELSDEEEYAPLTSTQIEELRRRVAAVDANPEAVTPWEVVKARALARLSK
jgi:putative addiction module component (TIGR02574 family)